MQALEPEISPEAQEVFDRVMGLFGEACSAFGRGDCEAHKHLRQEHAVWSEVYNRLANGHALH